MTTKDPKRIERAHYLLDRLEDLIVGFMSPPPPTFTTVEQTAKMFIKRLEAVHTDVIEILKELNETVPQIKP
jgi:hypothetical protein